MSNSDDEITLNGVSQVILIYLFTAQLLGTCLNMLVVVAFFRSSTLFNANNLLTTNVFLAETLFGMTLVYFYTINIGQTENHVSYAACQVTGALVMTCAWAMIFTLVLGAYYRYLIIVHDRPSVQVSTMFLVLGGFWITSPLAGLLSVLPEESIIDRHTPSNFGGACLPRYATRKPLGLAVSIVTFLVLFLTPLNIAYAYYSIWRKLHKVRVRIRSMLHVGTFTKTIDRTELDTDGPKGRQRIQNLRESDNRTEREILKRGVLISSLFFIGFCPLACVWLYECITMRLVPYYITGLTHMMVATHSFVSPLVVVTQDKMYRSAVVHVLSPTLAFFTASPTGYPMSTSGTQTVPDHVVGTSLSQSIDFETGTSLHNIAHIDSSTTALAPSREKQMSSREVVTI